VLGSDDPADCSGCYEGFDAEGLEGSEELVDGGIRGEGDEVDGRERHVSYISPIYMDADEGAYKVGRESGVVIVHV